MACPRRGVTDLIRAEEQATNGVSLALNISNKNYKEGHYDYDDHNA